MKKIVAIVVFFPFWILGASAENLSVNQYRKLMADAFSKASSAQTFYSNTRQYNEKSEPLMIGFKAIAELMMCNHVINPLNKLSYFNRGKKNLELAIAKDPQNTELRFMRFCTQVTSPSMLGYNDDLKSDKQHLLQYLNAQKKLQQFDDEDLYQNVKKYLINSKQCNQQDIDLLKKL